MRVLIAEDDPISRKLLERTLCKWGYEAVVACDGTKAWDILNGEDSPRLAILDWMMPGIDGVEICGRIRRNCSEPYVYVILLTAKNQREDLIAGMDAGADDYLIKPFDPHELKVRLRAGKRILDLQSQLIAAREALRIQAIHDPLTGLYNRGAVMDFLRLETERTKRHHTPLSLIMADFDHFKDINDTHGHIIGDQVLIEVADRLRHACRSHDLIGRYGGDEFLVVLPGIRAVDAAAVAERVRADLWDQTFNYGKTQLCLSASLGVTEADLSVCETIESFIDRADSAAYSAKKAGRNQVCVTVPPTGGDIETPEEAA